MSHKQQRVLDAVFQEPVSANIHWRDVESLLHHLGATIESMHGARMRVILNGIEATLHRPHHSGVCDKHEVRHLRDFLTAAGVSASSNKSGDAS
jgi:hypothetical protein